MKLLDSMQEAGTAVKCLITLAAVLAALSIAAVAAFAALTRRAFVVMLFSHAGPPKSWCLP